MVNRSAITRLTHVTQFVAIFSVALPLLLLSTPSRAQSLKQQLWHSFTQMLQSNSSHHTPQPTWHPEQTQPNRDDSNGSDLNSQSCLQQFSQTQPPVLRRAALQQRSTALCYAQFAVLYSGVAKTPLWVAQWLRPQHLQRNLKRENVFHEELQLAAADRARLADYRDSGFDRGHMAPSGDMASRSAQTQSFSLANMVPQHPENNQNAWRNVEEATRAWVKQQQRDVYIVTGPLYEKAQLRTIGQGVLVPTSVYKLIYVPSLGIASAYVAPNDGSLRVDRISVCALEQRLHINLLPQLSVANKRGVYNLPLNAKQAQRKTAWSYLSTDQSSVCPNVSSAAQQQVRQQFQQAQSWAESDGTAFERSAAPQEVSEQNLPNAQMNHNNQSNQPTSSATQDATDASELNLSQMLINLMVDKLRQFLLYLFSA